MSNIKFADDREFDIVTIGRAAIDLNSDDFGTKMENVTRFSKFLGGSPANIAVASARLKQKTGFIGKVANDQFGRFITNYFYENGIDTSQLVVDQTGAKTGLTFTEIISPTDCSILMYREGAVDLKLSPEDVSEDFLKKTKSLLISGTALSMSPSREAIFVALEYAKKHGVKLIFDIDYRPYTWKSDVETSIYYSLVAQQCDVIIGTREEFEMMDHVSKFKPESDQDIAQKWLDYGAEIVVVKRGAAGSIAFTKSGESFEQLPFPAKIIKTFGAGDSYAAAFIYGLMNNYSVKDAMELGSASASLVISSQSCSDAMPTIEQITTFIQTAKKSESVK
ncbi:5-dehydro-2-deoxygluconokinase [Alkalihalobacillus sp. BA299]|uniref:5-dehydro-2-deoxygluconokinase n=1 Tax=Alkalihalobacillus sp. BA299 TaxID=2815938 RepID=UPI001AD981B8|nr:5-dehydro-2-deoxygluconokinase [Alkalihalobacillus sp. BA299]